MPAQGATTEGKRTAFSLPPYLDCPLVSLPKKYDRRFAAAVAAAAAAAKIKPSARPRWRNLALATTVQPHRKSSGSRKTIRAAPRACARFRKHNGSTDRCPGAESTDKKTSTKQARQADTKHASKSNPPKPLKQATLLTFRAPDLSSRNTSRTNSVLWGLSGSTSCAKTYPARARVASAAPTASLHPSAFAVTESTVSTFPLMKPLAFIPAPAAQLLLLMPPLLPLPFPTRAETPL